MANLSEIKKRKLKPRQLPVQEIEQVPTFELFDYQKEDAEKTIKTLEARGRDFLAMATGLGKTRTSIEIIKNVSRKPKKILVLADQTQLLEDHKKVFNAYMGKEYAMTDFTGKSFIARKNPPEYEVVFATRQSMRNYIDSDSEHYLPPGFFDFILDDESHHAMAKTYAPTLNYFQPNYLLGMTGTPDRSDWKDIREIFGEPTVTRTLEEGMANGWLTQVDYDLVTMDVDEVELEKLIEDKGKTLTKEELEKLIFKEKSLEEVLQHMVNAVGDKQTGIMCDSIEQAEKVSHILREWGYIAESFHSQSGDDGEQLIRFRRKTSGFLSAVNKMNEGIDVPEMEAVVFLRSTNSKTIFLQQLGRVLRKYPGKERALVLDYVGTIERLDLINQLILDSESEKADAKSKDVAVDKKIHGGKNVFRFNRGVVDKIAEILKRNERRKGGERNEKKDVRIFSLEETKKIAKLLGIKTFTQYRLFAEAIFPQPEKDYGAYNLSYEREGRLPELDETIINKLGLKSVHDGEKLTKKELGESQDLMTNAYNNIVFPYFKQLPTWRKRGFTAMTTGFSEYKSTDDDLLNAYDRLFAISKDKKNSMFGRESGFKWVDVYGLHFEQAQQDAADCLAEIVNEMEKRKLLTPDFFSPEIFDVVAEDILHQIHIEYFGNGVDHDNDPQQVKLIKAKYGPYKGKVVSLSGILNGEPVSMGVDASEEFCKKHKIETEIGYRLWSQRTINSLCLDDFNDLNDRTVKKIGLERVENNVLFDSYFKTRESLRVKAFEDVYNFLEDFLVIDDKDKNFRIKDGLDVKGISKVKREKGSIFFQRNPIVRVLDKVIGLEIAKDAPEYEKYKEFIRFKAESVLDILEKSNLLPKENEDELFLASIVNYACIKFPYEEYIENVEEMNEKSLDEWMRRFVIDTPAMYNLWGGVVVRKTSGRYKFPKLDNKTTEKMRESLEFQFNYIPQGFISNPKSENEIYRQIMKKSISNFMSFVMGEGWYSDKEKEKRPITPTGISQYRIPTEKITGLGIMINHVIEEIKSQPVGRYGVPVGDMFTVVDSQKTMKICNEIMWNLNDRKLLTESFFDKEVVETMVRIVAGNIIGVQL